MCLRPTSLQVFSQMLAWSFCVGCVGIAISAQQGEFPESKEALACFRSMPWNLYSHKKGVCGKKKEELEEGKEEKRKGGLKEERKAGGRKKGCASDPSEKKCYFYVTLTVTSIPCPEQLSRMLRLDGLSLHNEYSSMFSLLFASVLKWKSHIFEFKILNLHSLAVCLVSSFSHCDVQLTASPLEAVPEAPRGFQRQRADPEEAVR